MHLTRRSMRPPDCTSPSLHSYHPSIPPFLPSTCPPIGTRPVVSFSASLSLYVSPPSARTALPPPLPPSLPPLFLIYAPVVGSLLPLLLHLPTMLLAQGIQQRRAHKDGGGVASNALHCLLLEGGGRREECDSPNVTWRVGGAAVENHKRCGCGGTRTATRAGQ